MSASVLDTLFALTIAITIFFPVPLHAAEKVILNVSLNGEPAGDHVVLLKEDGDILIKQDELKSLGVKDVQANITVEGDQYCSLKSIESLTYYLDEKKLTLAITVPPRLLQKKSVIDLIPRLRQNVYYPRETSAFLGYGLMYSHVDPLGNSTYSLNNKLGVRSGDLLFRSDSLYTKTEDRSNFVRLMTNVTYEDRADLRQLVVGDSFASSGELGSTINIGGISFSKMYKMDPYLIKYPMLDFSGVVSTPSVAEIYLDGMLLRREKLAPGQFELKNLDYYGGERTAEVVIRDGVGNEQHIIRQLYFTNSLLQKGFHEYNYTVGFLRERFGYESNKYGDPALSMNHQYGLRNDLTVGVRGEATNHLLNFGPQAAYLIPHSGVITVSAAASSASGVGGGHAGSLNYNYQKKAFNSSVFYRRYSQNYTNLDGFLAEHKPKTQRGIGAAYGSPEWGFLSLNLTQSILQTGQTGKVTDVTYTKSAFRNLNAFVTYRNVKDTERRYEVLAGFTYIPDRDYAIMARHASSRDSRTDSIQVQKNLLSAQGLAYGALIENGHQGNIDSTVVNPSVQYNGRYGIYTADYLNRSIEDKSTNRYTLSASGAIVYADDTIGFTRPVNDSFSIVKVDNLEGALVKVNNVDIGRTDSSGKIIIPELKSYNQNQITLETKDMPIEYQVSQKDIYVSPSAWGGSCLAFDVAKLQAVTGRLYGTRSGKRVPLEYYQVVMTVGSREVTFMTGRDGEFYFENMLPREGGKSLEKKYSCRSFSKEMASGEKIIRPGKYRARIEYDGHECFFDIVVPETREVIIDLGEVDCEQTLRTKEIRVPVESPVSTALPVSTQPVPAVGPETDPYYPLVVSLEFDKSGNFVRKKDRKLIASILKELEKNKESLIEIELFMELPVSSEAASNRVEMKQAELIRKYLTRQGVPADRISKVQVAARKKAVCNEEPVSCDNPHAVVKIIRKAL